MKINGNAIKIGNILRHKDKLWLAIKTQHTQPGKGGAYLQVELKDIRNGTKLNERFRSSETVERVHMDEQPYQFLFQESSKYTFMHCETYEQIILDNAIIGKHKKYLQEGIIFTVNSFDDEIISVSPPKNVVMEITDSQAVVKGQTVSSSYKPAILENGQKIMVPPHIATHTKIIINTDNDTYVEKAK